jgi:hypothetical protein
MPMLERAQVRTLPLLNRGVELAPAVNACCGACRTCLTSNALTVAGAAIVGAAAYLRRFLPRR